VCGVVAVRHEPFDRPDRNGPLQFPPRTFSLAGSIAGAAEGTGKGRVFQVQAEGLLDLPAPDERDVPVNLDAGGAGERAGGSPESLDHRFLGHGLGEGNVSHTAGDQIEIELISDRNGTGEFALGAAGAGRRIDEGRLLAEADLETSVLTSRDRIDFRVGQEGDVGVVCGGGHLGGGYAARAVQGRENLAQKDLFPADARFLFDKKDFIAHVTEGQRRFHSGNAAANDEDIHVHFSASQDEPRPRSAL